MSRAGDFVRIPGYYIADCPHHIDTKTFYAAGKRFATCPACPEPRPDDPKVTWTLVASHRQDPTRPSRGGTLEAYDGFAEV